MNSIQQGRVGNSQSSPSDVANNAASTATVSRFAGAQTASSSAMDNLLNQLSHSVGKHKVINGTKRDDTLNGGKQNDRIDGKAGNDLLYGNEGNDQLYGGAGDDLLHGGDGDDFLSDNQGSNSFVGGLGNDTMQLSGRFADYEITQILYIRPPGPGYENALTLRDKRTGEEQFVQGVDQFNFRDTHLSVEALLEKLHGTSGLAE